MADKIKPLKIENIGTGGTQNDGFPTETDPNQDYLAAKGVAFENNDNILIDADPITGEIRYKDPVQSTYKKLNEITGGGADNFSYHKVAINESVIIPTNQHMITTSLEVDGFIDVEGSVVLL